MNAMQEYDFVALSHCKAALTLFQAIGISLVKDCEELLTKIQTNLGELSE